MTRVTKEVLKDVENQLHDFMISIDALNVAMEKLLGQGQENMEALVDAGYTVTVSPATNEDFFDIHYWPGDFVVRVSMEGTLITSANAEKLSDALAMAYENTRPIEEESK